MQIDPLTDVIVKGHLNMNLVHEERVFCCNSMVADSLYPLKEGKTYRQLVTRIVYKTSKTPGNPLLNLEKYSQDVCHVTIDKTCSNPGSVIVNNARAVEPNEAYEYSLELYLYAD